MPLLQTFRILLLLLALVLATAAFGALAPAMGSAAS